MQYPPTFYQAFSIRIPVLSSYNNMARSIEAIQRRALKRQRTVDEQRQADRQDMEKQQQQRQQLLQERHDHNDEHERGFGSKPLRRDDDDDGNGGFGGGGCGLTTTTVAAAADDSGDNTATSATANNNKNDNINDPMKEVGAWICPKCNNENFSSRNWCNSKTCDQVRPSNVPVPTPQRWQQNYHLQQQQGYQGGQRRQLRQNNSDDPLKEPGAWKCVSCGNRNYASRDICYSKSCDQRRPEESSAVAEAEVRRKRTRDTSANPNLQQHRQRRHDELTSKKLVWSKQATPQVISKNQELRQQYLQTNGDGMSLEDIERAKILIARDERKKQKKKVNLKNKNKETSEQVVDDDDDDDDQTDNGKQLGEVVSSSNTITPFTPDSNKAVSKGEEEEIVDTIQNDKKKKEKKKKSKEENRNEKSIRDKNRALRERYLETLGKGMKPEDIERAKLLLQRDERKKRKDKDNMGRKEGQEK